MEKRTGSITLDGRTFEVLPLKLGQLKVILPMVADLPSLGFAEQIDKTCQIVVAAVPGSDLTVGALLDMEIDQDDLRNARDEVLRVAGLVQKGEAKATADQSNGATSTAP